MLVLVVFLIWAAVLRSFWGLIRGKEIEATFHNSTGNDFPKDSLESKNVAKKSKDQKNQTCTTPAGTSENAIASSSTTAGPVSSSPIISQNATTLRVPSVFARYHLSQDRSFLKSPVEKKLGTMQCKITRTPDKLMFFFELEHCTGDKGGDHATPIFLLKGKKPLVGLNVYLSNNEHDQASSVAMRASHGYMGKLSINNKDCNEFCLLDNGLSMKSRRHSIGGANISRQDSIRRRATAETSLESKANGVSKRTCSDKNTLLSRLKSSKSSRRRENVVSGQARQELLRIKMTRPKFGESRNREMEVLCPRVAQDGSVPVCYQQSAPTGVFSALSQWTGDKLTRLQDKKAEWDREHRVLNFHGRVTRPSIKNFQLEEVTTSTVDDQVVLQCGRTGNQTFIVDFSWPLSPMQAFAIALCKLTAS